MTLVKLTVLLSLVLGSNLGVCGQESDSLEFLRNTLPEKKSYRVSEHRSVKFEFRKLSGCEISWRTTILLDGAPESFGEVSFSLSDIDPSKLKLRERTGEFVVIEFYTKKKKKSIKGLSWFSNWKKDKVGHGSQGMLSISGREYANKVLAAFQSAVEKCQ